MFAYYAVPSGEHYDACKAHDGIVTIPFYKWDKDIACSQSIHIRMPIEQQYTGMGENDVSAGEHDTDMRDRVRKYRKRSRFPNPAKLMSNERKIKQLFGL